MFARSVEINWAVVKIYPMIVSFIIFNFLSSELGCFYEMIKIINLFVVNKGRFEGFFSDDFSIFFKFPRVSYSSRVDCFVPKLCKKDSFTLNVSCKGFLGCVCKMAGF